jgi:hypothetical protein
MPHRVFGSTYKTLAISVIAMSIEGFDIIGSFLLLFVAVVYVIGKRVIEKASAKTRTISDEEHLLHLARLRRCSEYDIFKRSATLWHVSEEEIQRSFKKYLLTGFLPHYVRDYVRKNKLARRDLENLIFNSGGLFLPSWENSSDK